MYDIVEYLTEFLLEILRKFEKYKYQQIFAELLGYAGVYESFVFHE